MSKAYYLYQTKDVRPDWLIGQYKREAGIVNEAGILRLACRAEGQEVKMAEGDSIDDQESVESLLPSEQSDTLNRNAEPVAEVSRPVETLTWPPIQTRNRRKTLMNYLE